MKFSVGYGLLVLTWFTALFLTGCGQQAPVPLSPTAPIERLHLLVPNFGGDSLALRAVDPATGATAPLPGSPLTVRGRPKMVVITPDRRFVYIPTQENGIAGFTVDPVGGTLTALAGSPFAGTQGIFAAVVHPNGRFLIGSGGKRVTSFAINVDGSLSPVPGGSLEIDSQTDLAFNPPVLARAGHFCYVAGGDRGIYAVAIHPDKGLLTSVTVADFGNVRVLAVHPNGQILCAPEVARHALRSLRVEDDGSLTSLAQFGLDFDPLGAAFARAGRLYLGSDSGRGLFGFDVNGADGSLAVLNNGLGFASGSRDTNFPVVDPSDRLLYVSARGTDQVFGYHIQPGGDLSPASGSPASGFAEPDWPALLVFP